MDSFAARRARVIEHAIASIDPQDTTRGELVHVAACYHARRHVAWADARFLALAREPQRGDMFWMYPLVAAMLAGREVMSAGVRMRARELWRDYFPYRGDTENHWLLYHASLYLAAQENAESAEAKAASSGAVAAASGEGDGAGRGANALLQRLREDEEAWFNGRSTAENFADAREYLYEWMRLAGTLGLGEFDSPYYVKVFATPLALLAAYAADEEMRARARMTFDLIALDYAADQLGGLYGGAHSRAYERHAVEPATAPAAAMGWLWFGAGVPTFDAEIILLALTGCEPAPAVRRAALERDRPFVNRERRRTRWQVRHAQAASIEDAGKTTTPVYKYTYVHPDFVLGSCQGGLLQPIQQQTWSLVWREEEPRGRANSFFALHPYSSPVEGATFFAAHPDTVVNLIARSKIEYDRADKLSGGSPHEQVMQHGAALIALYDIPDGVRHGHINTFVSAHLADVTEDASGWIFARGGAATYLAWRPLAPYAWHAFDRATIAPWDAYRPVRPFAQPPEVGGHRRMESAHRQNGLVVQVASAREFASFAEFQAAVRRLSLRFVLTPKPEVWFTALDGAALHLRHGDEPTVDGRAVGYADWPYVENPFAYSAAGSGRVVLREADGGERVLDFSSWPTPDASRAQHVPARRPASRARVSTAGGAGGERTFYAALAMTKAQQNSSLPTDSGVYRQEQDGAWTRVGPKIHIISGAFTEAREPGTLYFACGNGLLRVRDGGHTWRMLGGWRINDAMALAFDAADARRLYLATAWGVWRSDDGGESWLERCDGLAKRFVPTLAADRTRAGRVLAGTEAGLSETRDGGESWRSVTGPRSQVWRVQQSGAQPAQWLAATQGEGVWQSDDNGASWTRATGVPAGNFYDVALNADDPADRAAGGWGVGVWRSRDGGATWRELTRGLPSANVFTVAYDPRVPGRLWASVFEEGVFSTDDDGATWQHRGLAGAYVSHLTALPAVHSLSHV